MRIRFVTETKKQRWVLRYWAESLAAHIPQATVGLTPDEKASVNIFINYALYEPTCTKTAALFTHREFKGSLRQRFDTVARRVDWCFAQSRLTATLLPSHKTTVLRMYPQPQFYKGNVILGVVGKDRESGRKRFPWVKDLEAIKGVTVMQARGTIPLGEMPAFYKSLDYLVVLAENEGGPMPVIEALAMGVPVIAPNVGNCWEFPVLRYATKKELLALVRGLVVLENGWKESGQIMSDVLQKLVSMPGEMTVRALAMTEKRGRGKGGYARARRREKARGKCV